MVRYQTLANEIKERVSLGAFAANDKLPSLRQMAADHQVSVSTVQQAYLLLEQDGLIESRPRSGFVISAAYQEKVKQQRLNRPPSQPKEPINISKWADTKAYFNPPDPLVAFIGVGKPDSNAPTLKPLTDLHKKHIQFTDVLGDFCSLAGEKTLLEQIAYSSATAMNNISSDEIITTQGCQQAISMALRLCTKPGDTVAFSEPGFFGLSQILQAQGLNILEIPVQPEGNLSVGALKLALRKWPIKAIILNPTLDNPTSQILSEPDKLAIIELAEEHDFTIIEDDIFGDLVYQQPRPATMYSLDSYGRVILCSSFSKTVATGLRVGWMFPGKHYEKALQAKYADTGLTIKSHELLLAEFLQSGHYHRHIQAMRQLYQKNLYKLQSLIRQHFPTDTLLQTPKGGFQGWLELPTRVDTTAAFEALYHQGYFIAPGTLFSANSQYTHAMRVNFSSLHKPEMQRHFKHVGKVLCEHEQS